MSPIKTCLGIFLVLFCRIKESIEEYSMDFEGVSGTGSEIAEMISASHQASQSRQSKFYPKSKPALPKPEIIE